MKMVLEEAESAELNFLLSEFEIVFGDDMGEMKDFQATLELNQRAVHKLFSPKICAFCSEECDIHRVKSSSGCWHIKQS